MAKKEEKGQKLELIEETKKAKCVNAAHKFI